MVINLDLQSDSINKVLSEQYKWLYMPSRYFFELLPQEIGSSKLPADDATLAEVPMFTLLVNC